MRVCAPVNFSTVCNTAFLMSSNPDYSRYLIQFCLIVVATLPILVAFPFFLNTIEKGALTGGVKE